MKACIDYDGVQRIEQFMIHKDTFREILLNAIVREDYSNRNPIHMMTRYTFGTMVNAV